MVSKRSHGSEPRTPKFLSLELLSSRPAQPPRVHLNFSLSMFKPATPPWFSDSLNGSSAAQARNLGIIVDTPSPLRSPPKSSLSRSSVAFDSIFPLNSSFLSPSPSEHTPPPSCLDNCSSLPGSVSVPLWFVYSPTASVIFKHTNLTPLLYSKPFNGFPLTLK